MRQIRLRSCIRNQVLVEPAKGHDGPPSPRDCVQKGPPNHPIRPRGRGQGLPSSSPGRGCPAPTILRWDRLASSRIVGASPCGRPRGGKEGQLERICRISRIRQQSLKAHPTQHHHRRPYE
jgi:hypothetical protein